MNPFKDHLDFFRQFRSRFETTGAIAPSSRFLARALTRPLTQRTGPTRVLEVGPGTGAVTRAILQDLKPSDFLDLVEINEEFADLLRRKLADDPAFRSAAEQSEVHCLPLQDFRPEKPYDVIVSGLPFNNFPAALVEELIDHCLGLLAPGGQMTFFEYMFVRPARRVISPKTTRRRLTEIEHILQRRFDVHRVRTDWVFANIPPAWVQYLQIADQNGRAGN